MKNLLKFLFSLLLFMFAASPAAQSLAEITGVPNVVASLGIVIFTLATALISRKKRDTNTYIYACGVEKEMWADYIIKRFWKDNSFLNYAFNDDQYILGGAVVHIPQQGTKPVTVKNRNSFPAVAVRRSDNDITYVLEPYSTDPTHITNVEKIVPSYNKLDDVWGDHAGSVNEAIADDMLYKWANGTTNIVRTSGILTRGGAVQTTDATAAGATGLRILTVHRDVRKVRLLFNTQNVPTADRFGLLDENMADQIFESLSDNEARQFSDYADATTGVLGKLYGFNIMTRSSVASASNGDVVRALGAAGATTDNAVSLFWQKNSVARAIGSLKVFDNTDDALYYGDVISTEMRAGGRVRRSDGFGIARLTQGVAA